jgi:hypothetical protein
VTTEDLRQRPGRSRLALYRRAPDRHVQELQAIDVVCEGEWQIFVNTDPNAAPTSESEVAIIDDTTLTQDAIGMLGHSPLLKLRLVNEAPGPARLSRSSSTTTGGSDLMWVEDRNARS